MKIAIYGGAFNPVHNEHINIVRAAIDELSLDKVIVVPTAISPHKRTSVTARGRDRLNMCRLAFKNESNVEVSDYELKRGGISYSYVTCRHFKKLYPDGELFFIMGADMFGCFHLWKEPEEILKCATLAVCARENAKGLDNDIKSFNRRFGTEAVKFSYVGKAVSSTRVRALAALGEDIAAFVPEEVRNFIRKNSIYKLNGIAEVKKLLTDERWEHTVRVAVSAAEHARQAGVFEEDALIASMLHDCAKYLSPLSDELKGFTPPDKVSPPVMHQFSGAYVAEHTFGIKDTSILNAIRYHTTGRENMTSLEKLIYLADMLEEGRTFPEVEKLRKLFDADINGCLAAALDHQLEYLKSTGAEISPLTRRARAYMKETYDK
ncbi:MAG: nicotinate (nicotinamide) nucleotide adenylyltransferase [Clostridia bacterium]|nr:nicotinate (nicotinamide) nucleotide adenylyltransferase [Clostridia bacterium]